MIPGKYYFWPGCYIVNPKTGSVSCLPQIFYCQLDGTLFPKPVVGWSCSKLPEGEGIPWEYWQLRHKQRKVN